MRMLIEIKDSNKITVSRDIPGYDLFSACGKNQPPRDFAAQWKWDSNKDDDVMIYISQSLPKDKVLKALEPLLEKAKNIRGLKKLPKYLKP